jgi:hypothetical protein
MTSEPERLRDEPTENHKVLASGQAFPQSGEKKKWGTPTVRVEKFADTMLFNSVSGDFNATGSAAPT